MDTGAANRNGVAGFWVRTVATAIDLSILFVLLLPFRLILSHLGIYVPFESVALVLWAFGSAGLTWRFGGTAGKRCLGLRVCSRNGARMSLARAAIREIPGKVLSTLCFMLGFVKVGVSKDKRGYHDLLARTEVIRIVEGAGRQRLRRLVQWGVLLGIVAMISQAVWVPLRYGQIVGVRAERQGHANEITAGLVDVNDLADDDYGQMSSWLGDHGMSPQAYALEAIRTHQVIIFGEVHGKKEYLDFFNALLPAMYHEGGVACIALEWCRAADNDDLYRLVTAESFDDALALAIARRSVWASWGYREYWEVLRTVWEINHSRPEGKKPLRVVGLNFSWDGPSLALVRAGPPWERLRLWRVWDDFLRIVFAGDGLYAGNVEDQILKRGERGVVWVGAAHLEASRMGGMLHGRYGDKVARIVLHTDVDSAGIAAAIDRAVVLQDGTSVGFSVSDSPFRSLRDRSSRYYQRGPAVCFADVAEGYLFLQPVESLTWCSWWDGFVSRTMFGRNRPFYELLCNRKLRDNVEANRYLEETGGILAHD